MSSRRVGEGTQLEVPSRRLAGDRPLAAALLLCLLALPVCCLAMKAAALTGKPVTAAHSPSNQPEEKTAAEAITVADFGPGDVGKSLPNGWERITFDPKRIPRQSSYDVIRLEGQGGGEDRFVLRAQTSGGASAIYRRMHIDPEKYPYLVWSWRVDQIFAKANERTKQGDDYPARLYIGFRYAPSRVDWMTRIAFRMAKARSKQNRYPPLYVLNYVWANKLKRNAWMSNPWQERSKMIAVRSGRKGLKSWRREGRNYLKDFQAIVGEKPTPVEFVAIMIDGDGTGSRGVCYFDDIEFRARPPTGLQVESLGTSGKESMSGCRESADLREKA